MAFNPEQEVQPENIEMIGRPVQESSCVETRPWPGSDKQSHNHPGPADTMGINSKPVFAHDEEMTKTGVEEEGLAVCEMMEEAEGVEEGKMEEKAEEKVAEAELGVLCSFEGMPGSCLSPPENMEALPQEAEPQSPAVTAEHEPHLATSMTKPEPIVTAENGPHLATSMTKPEPIVTVEHGTHLANPMTKPEPAVTAEQGPHLATTMTKPESTLTAENGLHLATTMTKPEPTITAENGPHLATTMTKREPTLTAENGTHLANPMTKPEPAVTAENGPHLATPMTKPEPAVTVEHGPHLATTMAEHEPRPDGSTAEGQIKVTDRIAGQKKVFRKRQKAKPKMQTAEAAGTEGGPLNIRAPFRLQDFMCFKISKHTVLFLLMLLASTVYSNETPKPVTGDCAVCQDHRCATDTTAIWKGNNKDNLWKKETSNCSMDNLNSDVACRMPNGWLVLLTDQHVLFERRIPSGGRRPFPSENKPCTELGLHSSPKLSPATQNTSSSNPSTNSTNSTDSTNSTTSPGILDLLTGNYAIGIGVGLAVILVALAACIAGGLIYKKRLYNCLRGQNRGHRQGINGVPPHDAEHPDEIIVQMQPLKGEVVNGVH